MCELTESESNPNSPAVVVSVAYPIHKMNIAKLGKGVNAANTSANFVWGLVESQCMEMPRQYENDQ